jgi:predicted oxidoreductase (fatty acid repression mutant protein)
MVELLNKIGHVLTADLTKDFKFKRKQDDSTEITFVDQLKKRRSIYKLGKKVHFSQAYIAELIQESVRSCPSAFNAQSTRIVVLFGESHQQFWDIAKEAQKRNVPNAIFESVEMKIDQCAHAFGTVLFYEDQEVIQQLQKKMPFNAADFPVWSEQTSGMAQFAVWTSLADSGMGASLQHYNPLIDSSIADHYSIAPHWLMRAQLVFGSIEEKAAEKEEQDDYDKFRVYA